MTKQKRKTTDFAEFIRSEWLAKDPALSTAVEQAGVEADIAEEIYRARIDAKLTQTQLAEMIGTHQSVIARLEDADYQGHSVAMLRKIATATNKRLHISFCAKADVKRSHTVQSFKPQWHSEKWSASGWSPTIDDRGISKAANEPAFQ